MTTTTVEPTPIADLAAVPFGTRVRTMVGALETTGTVHGRYAYGNDRLTQLWITDPDMPTAEPPYAYRQGTDPRNLASGREWTWDELGDWQSEPGQWTHVGQPVYLVEPEPDPEPEPAALSEQAAQVTALEATVSDLRAQVAEAQSVIRQIGEALAETADQSEWCGEYERRVEELYRALPGRFGLDQTFREAAVRSREYEVCVHWTVTYSTTVSVEAASEEAAVNMVSEDPHAYVDVHDGGSYDDTTWDEIHAA